MYIYVDFQNNSFNIRYLLVTSAKPLFEVMQRMSKKSNLPVQPFFFQSDQIKSLDIKKEII